jgi:AhpC/TSA family protein
VTTVTSKASGTEPPADRLDASVSVDSNYSHGAWATVRGIAFPLLADFNPKGAVAKMYNVWRERDGFSERALSGEHRCAVPSPMSPGLEPRSRSPWLRA